MARKADPTIRGRLLNAARQEFAEHGLVGALLSNVTARAGVSKGAFYLHFRSKEDAFEEVAEAFFSRFFVILDRVEEIALSDLEPSRAMELISDGDVEIMDYLWDERVFARVLFEGAHSPRQCHLIERFAERVQARVERLLSIDQELGRILPDIDIRVLALFVAGGFDRYARVLLASGEKPNVIADLRQLQTFICRGAMTQEFLAALSSAAPQDPR